MATSVAPNAPSAAARLHRARRLEVLARHPELAALNGANPWSLACVLILVALHLGTAWLVSDSNIVIVFLTALFFGQFVLHAGGSLVHEAAHGLILSRRKRWVVDLALETLLTSFGHHAQYQLDHIHSHHPHLGDYERDYEHKDACRVLGRALLRNEKPATHWALIALHLALDLLPLGFLISDDLVAAIERRVSSRSMSDAKRNVQKPSLQPRRRWILSLWSLLVLAMVLAMLGPLALLYWVWALSIFQGRWAVTNVGQVLSEHPRPSADRPTHSYYGPWNYVLFNTGYHDEHHTFPRVAWNRLPRIKDAAPESFTFGDDRGYVAWWFDYVFRGTPRRPSEVLREPGARCER